MTGDEGDILMPLLLSEKIAGAEINLPFHFAGIHFRT